MPSFEPFHKPHAHLTPDTLDHHIAKKRNSLRDLIPSAWKLNLPSPLPDDVRNIPKSCGILSAEELAITEQDDPNILIADLASGRLSSVTVTTAFLKRAAIAHQVTNCLIEFYPEEAMLEAKRLDAELKRTGKTVGPLHGLPVSLKDQFDIKGRELTMGYASWLGRISKRNSALVDCVLKAGAVIYCRTNVPQTLLHGETDNPIIGLTVNPYNRQLTPGGSSGGEGALIAMKGSPLGVGTDIGGSVRIPAGFCGIYAHRPSTARIPYGHASNSWLGQANIVSAIGPMCRSVEGCTTFFKSILAQNPQDFDATAIPLPFQQDRYDAPFKIGKLCFGIAHFDEHVMPWPPILRAINEVEKALIEAGHKVIPFPLAKFKRIPSLTGEIFFADAAQDLKETFAQTGEKLHPVTPVAIPDDPLTVYQTYQLNREKEHYQQLWLQTWLETAQETGTGRAIDGLIFPIGPTTAAKPSHMDYDNYTSIFNLLDIPATAFPVTFIDKALDKVNSNFQPVDEMDARNQKRFDPDLMHGTPVGLQVAGRRWQDEYTLGIATIISRILSKA